MSKDELPDIERINRESGWYYYLSNYDELRYICLKASKGDENQADEWMSDVVLVKLPRILELWDRSKPLRNYVNSTVKWYVFKEVCIKERNFGKHATLDVVAELAGEQAPQVVDEEVQYLLEPLDDFERQLVILYVVHEFSYRELGEHCNMSRTAVSKIVRTAFEKIREHTQAD